MFSLDKVLPTSCVRQIQIFMRKTRGKPANPVFAAQRANAYLISASYFNSSGVQNLSKFD